MKVSVQWYDKQFNVLLASGEGKEPFLTIKGCRIVEGNKGEFVSWPARKMDDGKWWNHVYSSEAFGQAVIEEAKKSKPAQDTRTLSQRRQRPNDDDDSSIPF